MRLPSKLPKYYGSLADNSRLTMMLFLPTIEVRIIPLHGTALQDIEFNVFLDLVSYTYFTSHHVPKPTTCKMDNFNKTSSTFIYYFVSASHVI